MERKISIADLRKAVDETYESLKDVEAGAIDPRNIGAEGKKFGIAVVLTDGTVIARGDTDVKTPLGSVGTAPLMSLIFAQGCPMDEMKKLKGGCPCSCSVSEKPAKPKTPGFCPKALRAFSMLEPVGDADSKYNFFVNRVADLSGAAPDFDDKIYQAVTKAAADGDVENKLAAAGYELYDSTPVALDLYAKSEALKLSARDMAVMGATIAADGVNTTTGNEVFDGAIAQNVTGFMAAESPHKMRMPFLAIAGLPANSSFGGAIMGVLPGTFGIAAYAPEVNDHGVSIKAARALITIMKKLDLSAFSSARVTFVP